MRRRFKRPTATGRRNAHADSTLSGFGAGLPEDFGRNVALGSDFTALPEPFHTIEDVTVGNFDNWDSNLHLFSPVSPLPLATTTGDHLENQDVENASSEAGDGLDALTSQLTALSQRTMRTIRYLIRSGSTCLTVSSPQINEAFKDTNSLIRIINDISGPSSIDTGQPMADEGLIFLALASHQHILGLFRAICNSIRRCLESIDQDNEQQKQSIDGEWSSSVAQFVMVLQLLMHLINRIDRSMFHKKTQYPDGQITPVTPTSLLNPLLMEEDDNEGSRGLSILAQASFKAIPTQHVKLRHTIQDLQMRIERSEFL